MRVDGLHNLLNATAALGVAGRAGVALADAVESLGSFDDYGHVATEMAVTIETARRLGPRRVIALVQPHRYTRVQALWRELGASVAAADLVVVTDIYGAGQPPIPGVTGRLVAEGVAAAAPSTPTVYLPHRREVVDYLTSTIEPGDLVVTMGCGDVWMLGDAVRERILEAG